MKMHDRPMIRHGTHVKPGATFSVEVRLESREVHLVLTRADRASQRLVFSAEEARHLLGTVGIALAGIGREDDPQRLVAGWLFDAVKQALDTVHAVCAEAGCPPGAQVDEWLRERLKNHTV
jgi:hypothetical protein